MPATLSRNLAGFLLSERENMATLSLRRLSDKTLEKYQKIIESGEDLTPRQIKNLESHNLMTGEFGKLLLEAMHEKAKDHASS